MINEKTLEKILQPISVGNRAGEYLRYDNEATYHKIEEARKEDDPNTDRGIWTTEHEKKADWNNVKNICIKALEKRSKDLQIAAWLTEALLQLHKFTGLNEGLKIITGLCEEFWVSLILTEQSLSNLKDSDVSENIVIELEKLKNQVYKKEEEVIADLEQAIGKDQTVQYKSEILSSIELWYDLYPQIEDDDMDSRVRIFEWMNTMLSRRIRLLPITSPSLSPDSKTYNYQEMNNLKNDPEFQKSVSHTPPVFYEQAFNDISVSLDLLETLDKFLTDKCGRDSPSLNELKKVLKEVKEFAEGKFSVEEAEFPSKDDDFEEAEKEAEFPLKDDFREVEKEAEFPSKDDFREVEKEEEKGFLKRIGLSKTARKDMKPQNRDDAYKMLSEAADYLLKTEPHSPAPYLVKRAVSWKDMTLANLLKELIKDNNNLEQINILLGLKNE